MPIQVNGATSGSATLQATDAATVTLTLPSTSGTLVSSGAIPTATSIANGTSNVTIATSGGAVAVATNGTTAMTVNTSQQVGIGISSPTNKLYVSTNSTTATAKGLTVANTNASTANGAVEIDFYTDQYDGNTLTNKARITGSLDASNPANGYLAFSTVNSTMQERMRIDSSGNVFVGGTTQNTANTPVYSKSSAKAFVNFGGSNGGINVAFNVSSVTYNGTGDYTINFTNALQDNSYIVVGSAQEVSGSGLPTFSPYQTSPFTTSTARVRTAVGGTSLINASQVFAVVYR